MRRNTAMKKAISIAAVIVLLGFVACCALIAGIASGSSPALSGRFVLASLDDNEYKVRGVIAPMSMRSEVATVWLLLIDSHSLPLCSCL
jgi:uncharacterized oligopeptide transporter (OPT) family protein